MERLRALWSQVVTRLRAADLWIWREAAQILDLNKFQTATDWRGRFDAVSWRRVAIGAGSVTALGVAVGVGLWLMQPEFRSHPPRLPTEQEWRANQAAGQAMEAKLSPALAKANASVAP